MIKRISTEPHLLMMVVGPSGSGKSMLVADLLVNEKIFHPSFDIIFYIYQHWQPLYDELRSKSNKITFVQGLNWKQLKSRGNTKRQLLIFDDIYNEACNQAEFLQLVVSGRHQNQHAIILKHNLYQKGQNAKTIELNVTQMLLMKNPRDIVQIDCLGRQLGCRSLLLSAYKSATSKPFGHLLIDLDPRCDEKLRLCSQINSDVTIFYCSSTPQNIIKLDESFTTSEYFRSLYNS